MVVMMFVVEDNGRVMDVTKEELEALRFLVTRGEDGNYHPNADVTWEQIENVVREYSMCEGSL